MTYTKKRNAQKQRRLDKAQRMLATHNDDDVITIALPCRRCDNPTRDVPVLVADYPKISKTMYCDNCNSMVRGDDELFSDAYNCKYGDDIVASDLPLMDSGG
jgi:hypothetical protein